MLKCTSFWYVNFASEMKVFGLVGGQCRSSRAPARKIMVRSLHQNTYQPRWLSVSRCKKWSIFPTPYLNSFWRTIDVEDVEVLLRGEHDVPTLLRSSRNASVKKCYFFHLVNPNLLCESASIQHDLTMIFRAELVRGRSDIGQVCQLNACHPGSHFVSVFLEHSEQYHKDP